MSRTHLGASYIPVLYGESQYMTEWTLYQKLAKGIDISPPEDERMYWGKKLEPLILEASAEKLALEVTPRGRQWVESDKGPVGCKLDADVTCPSRGYGIVEAKNVDGYVHRISWEPAGEPPLAIQLQVQTQLLVTGAQWGVVAAFIGGNKLELYECNPVPEVQQDILARAQAMMDRVAKGDPPDPWHIPEELPILRQLWPLTREGYTVELDGEEALEMDEEIDRYQRASGDRKAAEAALTEIKSKVLHHAEDAEFLLTGGFRIKINRTRGVRLYIKER